MNELKKLLNPELINRIDDVIVFNALSQKDVSKILDIQLKELEERLKDKQIEIDIKPKAKNYLVEHGYNPSMGARPMRRLIRKEIEDPLSMEILKNEPGSYNCVKIECSGDKLSVKLVTRNTNKNKEMIKITEKRCI